MSDFNFKEMRYPISSLSAVDFNIIQNNWYYLRQEAVKRGCNCSHKSMYGVSASSKFAYIPVAFDNLEEAFDIINTQVAESKFYHESKDGVHVYFYLKDYKRWVDMINDLYGIIVEDKGKWQRLRLNDGIPQINGKDIVMRGEKIA